MQKWLPLYFSINHIKTQFSILQLYSILNVRCEFFSHSLQAIRDNTWRIRKQVIYTVLLIILFFFFKLFISRFKRDG